MALTKINTKLIANNTIALTNIADNAVDATKIASNSILTRHIDDDQITADQIVDDIALAGNISTTANFGVGAAPTNGGISRAARPVLSISGTVPELNFVDTSSSANDYWIRVSDGLQFGEASDSRMYLANGGNLGIGTTSPGANLEVASALATLRLTDTDGGYHQVRGNGASLILQADEGNDVSSSTIQFHIDGDEQARIDSNGRTLIGHTASIDNGSHPKLQVYHSGSSGHVGIGRWGASSSPPFLTFIKSRHSTVGSNTIVQDGDNLGKIRWRCADGNDFESEAASIYARVDGTPGQDDMPGELYFATTNDGGSSAVTRMVIKADGKIGIGNSTPGNSHSNANMLVVGSGSAGGMALYNGANAGGYYFARDNANNTDAYDGGMSYNADRDLQFRTNAGSVRMTIDGTGKIGIGTDSPSAGGIHMSMGNPNTTGDAHLLIEKTGGNDWTASFGSGADNYGVKIRGNGTYALATYDHNNTAYTARLTFGGELLLTNTTIGSISDRRLKENIVDANSQWNDIKALKWRNFKWKKESKTGTYLGLIADEVESISPNLVQIDAQPKEDIDAGIEDPEYKSVKYSIVWMKAMKALQEAQERIEILEAKVKTLEG